MAQTTNKLSSLTMFFPCYNEEKNLSALVAAAEKILPEIAEKYEVILVNDGSRDRTGAVAEELSLAKPFVRAVHHTKNRGYGGALQSGFAAAKMDWTFFSDGDLQFDLSELKNFVPFTKEHQAVIGYRIKRAEGFRRALNAKIFGLYIDMLFGIGVRDIDCAFKLVRTDEIRKLKLISNGAVISTELLYKLKRNGVVFKEIGVQHYLRQFGIQTGAKLRVIIKAGWESFKLFLKTRLR